MVLLGGDNESNNIFKLQKKVLQIICGVSNYTSSRQIFKDYNILTLFLLLTRSDVLLKNINILFFIIFYLQFESAIRIYVL
jgi:hypothetical protein